MPTLQKSYDWNKIKSNIEDIIFINSDNDPYGCGEDKGRIMFDKMGGEHKSFVMVKDIWVQ